jgi:hypothetical protein
MYKTIGKWLYLIGMLVAAVAGMFSLSYSWLSLIHAGIRFLVLATVAGALDSVPAVGPYLTGFFSGVVHFLAPVVLTLLVVYFVKKYFFAK